MAHPQRIVSLVPSHTESLHDLGVQERVVGRTRFCIAPAPWVDDIPVVGGTKDASLQKILDLRPDLVVVDKDENPLPLVESLWDAGVEVLVSEIDDVGGAADFLEVLAERCGVASRGRQEAEQIRALLAASPEGDPVPVFCPIWYDPWMTFDRTAYPHAMLEAAGFRNVFGDHEGPKYFQVEASDVEALTPTALLLPTEPFPFHRRLEQIDTTGLGAAGQKPRVIDGEALTWFGTRTASGLGTLRATRALFDGE